jgi:glycosyltransferase involved in cell wall biosynthesis
MSRFDARSLVENFRRKLRSYAWPRPELPTITLVGNPFESIGRSEHLRTIWRALGTASIQASIYDVYGHVPESAVAAEMGHRVVSEVSHGIRIFHLNGIEIHSALNKIDERQPGFLARGYNIVAPVWELPRYPNVWARELDRFDEIWAPTEFVETALRSAVSVPLFRLHNACEPHISKFLDRSNFKIPEDAFVILNFFDLRSFASRKNPWAVIEAFGRLIAARPAANVHLVLKLNYGAADPSVVADIMKRTSWFRNCVTVFDKTFTDNETKNLIRCCDCFLSLHRSEGFGRGPAEAMFFGKPVVATGWSGNMDYMDENVSYPIRFALIPVMEGEYPHFEEQVWADPDISEAADVLIRIVDNPALGRAQGKRAARHMQRTFSDATLGETYRRRLEAIVRGTVANVR